MGEQLSVAGATEREQGVDLGSARRVHDGDMANRSRRRAVDRLVEAGNRLVGLAERERGESSLERVLGVERRHLNRVEFAPTRGGFEQQDSVVKFSERRARANKITRLALNGRKQQRAAEDQERIVEALAAREINTAGSLVLGTREVAQAQKRSPEMEPKVRLEPFVDGEIRAAGGNLLKARLQVHPPRARRGFGEFVAEKSDEQFEHVDRCGLRIGALLDRRE